MPGVFRSTSAPRKLEEGNRNSTVPPVHSTANPELEEAVASTKRKEKPAKKSSRGVIYSTTTPRKLDEEKKESGGPTAHPMVNPELGKSLTSTARDAKAGKKSPKGVIYSTTKPQKRDGGQKNSTGTTMQPTANPEPEPGKSLASAESEANAGKKSSKEAFPPTTKPRLEDSHPPSQPEERPAREGSITCPEEVTSATAESVKPRLTLQPKQSLVHQKASEPRSKVISTLVTPAATRLSTLDRPDDEMRYGQTMAQITNSKTTEGWLARMSNLIHILEAPPEDEDRYEKVKVAVLDTGVDPNHTEADYIKGYKDYVSRNDDAKCDNSGHGTTSVRLILDMCASADVYALRIFEKDTATEQTLQLAIEALDWCMANDMDVVCMACGFFNDDGRKLYAKVQEASDKMLLVAAPTNDGNRHNILYPAAYEAFVLPMFATDGNVKKSGLNPSEGPGKYNFAILGENIKSVHGRVNSGTSYATAIAAGFAARLMDFSRHSDVKGALGDKAHEMKSKRGMMGVLRSMTTRTFDEPFDCIRPWDLLPTDLQNQLPFQPSSRLGKEARRSARKKIREKISVGLDGGWLLI